MPKSKKTKSPTKASPTRRKAAASASQKLTSSRKLPAAAPRINSKKSSTTAPKIKQEHKAAAAPSPDTANYYSGIDEVLSESDLLLRAAAEAQALGRLRNASTYLLLAHARLVGLGRRFDRSRIERSSTNNTAAAGAGGDNITEDGDDSKLSAAGGDKKGAMDPLIQGGESQSLPPLAMGSNSNPAATANDNNNNSEPMLFPHQTFHHMPDGVAYVEHIARAAMELHHKRTGRGMQHDNMVEKINAESQKRKMEQEQIRLAARGLFATAKGFTGVRIGAGSENSNDAPPKTRKRKADQATLDNEEKNALAKRKGGRGKKPPTLVMHTVVGKSKNVHDLMKGSLMKE